MHLDPLFRPRSIAIVGASDRPSIGRSLLVTADKLGFAGGVYPVNPKYGELLGRKCYPDIAALPEAPDLVAICVGQARVLEAFRALAEKGARSAVIYDGGFAESGAEGKKLQSDIVGLAREAGILLCGPNCMGILNPHERSSSYTQEPNALDGLAGNVGLVSQSGSICISLISDVRRFGFSHVISCGNEAVVSTDQYIEALIDDPHTKVIATFTESVRHPERYVAALDRAAAAGKPVVVLKVGRSERTRRAILSHTGGLAGESRVLSEILKAHRAIEVTDLDEMTEVLAVCQSARWPKGRGIAIVTGSGGQSELFLDIAMAQGFHLPPLSPSGRAEAERVIGHIPGDGNPLDAWGHGTPQVNNPHAFKVLDAEPGVDAIVFCSDSVDREPMGRPGRARQNAEMLAASARTNGKPHYMMNTRFGMMHTEQLAALKEAGIAMIGGTRQGLGAIDRLGRWGMPQPRPRPVRTLGSGAIAALQRGGARKTINEHDAKRLLGELGLSVTPEALCASLDDARKAAARIGYPVVLKAVSDAVAHKTELGLVILHIPDEGALAAAWAEMQRRLDAAGIKKDAVAGLLVQQMVRGGVEMFAGVSRDPDFGPCLAVGLGGTAIEVFRDAALRPLPLREGDAEAMLAELSGARLLEGLRGAPPADRAALVTALYTLSDFATTERDAIAEIDLNPIKVLEEGKGLVIVDALIVPAKPARG